MNILTDVELSTRTRAAFAVGAAIATVASVLLHYWFFAPPPAPIGTPQIVVQTPSQTVARIPTQRAGKRVDCTVTIDQAKNVWSITC